MTNSMRLLDTQTVLNAIDEALVINKDIEIIDWKLDSPYVCGTCNYSGITMIGPTDIGFHYSIFNNIFPVIFKLFPMTVYEQATWRALMAICLIKGFDIKLKTSTIPSNNFFDVIEVDSGHYLTLIFEQNLNDASQFEKIIADDDIGCYSYAYSNYKDLLHCFLLPMLNDEMKDFGMSFNSIDDLNEDNFLVFSALVF